MPLLITRSAASVRGFGFLSQAADYWMSYIVTNTLGRRLEGNNLTVDANNNIYVAGADEGFSLEDYGLSFKYADSGNTSWQKQLSFASQWLYPFGVALDSARGPCFVGLNSPNSSGTSRYGYVVRYNTDGAIQTQFTFGAASAELVLRGVGFDSSNNYYVVGDATVSGTKRTVFAKIDNSNNIQWQVYGNVSGNETYGTSVAVTASGAQYVGGYEGPSAQPCIFKSSTNGVVLWNRRLSVTNGGVVNDITLDASENVCVVGTTNQLGASISGILIAKFDSTGLLLWQRRFGTLSTNTQGNGVAVDSAGNVYAVGNKYIVKYDANGVLQWQRQFTGTDKTFNLRKIKIDSSGALCVTGNITFNLPSTFYGVFTVRLPVDGSLTGTYTIGAGVQLTYSASTDSDTLSTGTSTAPVFVSGPTAFSTAVTSYTDAASSYVIGTTYI